MLQEWTADLEKTVHAAMTRVEGLPEKVAKVETVIGRGGAGRRRSTMSAGQRAT